MTDVTSTHPSLRLEELEAVYSISRAVATAMDMDSALDEIMILARPVFIFDNMVLYMRSAAHNVVPAYARAIGRGRFKEAELAWGEATATEVLNGDTAVTRFEDGGGRTKERTRFRYLLGLPIHLEKELAGALVFIRFGGPPYESDQVRLSEFITGHVAQLLGHDRLVERIANLEAERRLNRLQEDFISTISHELLTPLGFIKGYATTLLREDTSWDEKTSKEFLAIIDEEADRLHELIENLMDSSRLQSGTLRMNFQMLRLDTFLKDIVMRASTLDDYLSLKLDGAIPDDTITADPTRLAQVFDNFFTNAKKYAPGALVKVSCIKEDDKYHFYVEDNGPGIPPEHLDHLFKRFYRVPTNETSQRGTGLGLFICRQIVRAHGGDIWVTSQIGKGTTFHISLPTGQPLVQQDISLRESA